MYRVDDAKHIYKGRIYAFYNSDDFAMVSSVNNELRLHKLIYVNESRLLEVLDDYMIDFKLHNYLTKTNRTNAIKKSLYQGFNFLNQGITKEEVLNVCIKASKYISKKIP